MMISINRAEFARTMTMWEFASLVKKTYGFKVNPTMVQNYIGGIRVWFHGESRDYDYGKVAKLIGCRDVVCGKARDGQRIICGIYNTKEN